MYSESNCSIKEPLCSFWSVCRQLLNVLFMNWTITRWQTGWIWSNGGSALCSRAASVMLHTATHRCTGSENYIFIVADEWKCFIQTCYHPGMNMWHVFILAQTQKHARQHMYTAYSHKHGSTTGLQVEELLLFLQVKTLLHRCEDWLFFSLRVDNRVT